MTNLTQTTVDILGYQIGAVKCEDGALYVPVKWVCNLLGTNHRQEKRKIKRRELFNWRILPVKTFYGKFRDLFCLPLKQLYLWFRLLNLKSVRQELVQSVRDYIREYEQALRIQRLHGIAIDPIMDARQIESTVRQSLEEEMGPAPVELGALIERQYVMLLTEVFLFARFSRAPKSFWHKAMECIKVAVMRFANWMLDLALAGPIQRF